MVDSCLPVDIHFLFFGTLQIARIVLHISVHSAHKAGGKHGYKAASSEDPAGEEATDNPRVIVKIKKTDLNICSYEKFPIFSL